MKRTLSIIAALCLGLGAGAKVNLPSVISDNMVLQQNTSVALWGTAKAKANVVITPSWTTEKTVVKADKDGKWLTRVNTPVAGGPYEITFSDGEATTISNVLVGEVWFCSGQSNMEMPVKGFGGQPVTGSSDIILTAKASRPLRTCTITRKASLSEETESVGSWQENTPDAVANASATAYFFGNLLQQVLDVPVGLLITDWGGTPIEAWMDRPTIESQFAGEFNLAYLNGTELPERAQKQPCTLFNGQVAPLIPFTFKGMLWYQGCDNRERNEQYERLQPAYVQMMRERFQNPDAPFYFVQLAPYSYGDPDSYTLGYMCESQQKTLATIPHSGMATTLDAGEYGTIHPCAKRPVGERLAYLALQNDYGITAVEATAPTFKSMEVKDGKAVLTFNVGNMGLAPIGQDLVGFEVSGADKVFHKATGRVSGKTVTVTCPEVSEPVAVRYGMHNWAVGTLFNVYGIPAGPFRTDDWKL